MADRTILQPINVREMWEKVVDDLASDDIAPPHDGITSKDIALMLLIRHRWDLGAIKEARDNSGFQEICDAIGVSRTPYRVALCLECISDHYSLKNRHLAAEENAFHAIPGCGHYCATHYRYHMSHAITVNGKLELKCQHHGCSTNYPMSSIPSDFVPTYHNDNLLELYKKEVDDDFLYYLEGRVSCKGCNAKFSAPSPGTYTCGKCSKPITRK